VSEAFSPDYAFASWAFSLAILEIMALLLEVIPTLDRYAAFLLSTSGMGVYFSEEAYKAAFSLASAASSSRICLGI